MSQVREAISLARSPAFTESRKMTWFLVGYRVWWRSEVMRPIWLLERVLACLVRLMAQLIAL
jgi:hypothetical protein